MRKFLFFVEREFHLSLLKNIMIYIFENNLGDIAVYSFQYQKSTNGFAEVGIREKFLNEEIYFEVEMIDNPYKYKPDITFLADFSYQYVEGLGKIVNIGHGTISKGWFFTDRNISERENCADLICVPGTIHKEKLEKKVFKEIKVTGMPKLDNLFNTKLTQKYLLEEYNLKKSQKTVLLAPTFNKEFTLLAFLTDSLRNYIPDEYNIIIKLHGATDESLKMKFARLSDRNKNIFYFNDTDITNAIIAADILISDVSSVIYEFTATGKPALLFNSPHLKQYPNYNKDDIEYKFRNIGEEFSNVQSIPHLLEEVSKYSSLTLKQNEISKKFITKNYKKSTEIVYYAAEKILFENKKYGTLIISLSDKKNAQKFIQRFDNHFELIFIGSEISNYKFVSGTGFSAKLKAAENALYENLIFLNDNWTFSPLFADLMISHLKNNQKIGMIVPIFSETENNLDSQNIKFIFNKNNASDKTFALQLTYSAIGSLNEIEFPLNKEIFCISKQTFTQTTFSEKSNLKISWLELIKNIYKEQKDIVISNDTYCYDKKTYEMNNKISELFPTIPETENILLENYKNNDQNIDDLRKLIYFYFYSENWEKLHFYTKNSINSGEIQFIKALAFYKEDDISRAKKTLWEINIENETDNLLKAEYYNLQAKISLKNNNLQKCLEFLSLAKSYNSNLPKIYLTYGTYYIINGNLDEAEKNFNTALELDSKNNIALNGLGLVSQQQRKFAKAIGYYKSALKINEEDLNSLSSLLSCAFKENQFEEIENALDNFLVLHPANIDFIFTLASIKFKLKKYSEALNLIEKLEILNNNFKGIQELKAKIINKL